MEVAPDAFPSFASAAQWTVMPFSDAPQDDPSRYVFTTSNKPVGAEDYVWRVADGANMPDDFFGMDRDPVSGAPRNAWGFVDPRCGSESPTCVTPMGGGTMRLTRPATGAVDFARDPAGAIKSAVLPACALAAGGVAEIARQLRGSLVEVLSSQVAMAEATGAPAASVSEIRNPVALEIVASLNAILPVPGSPLVELENWYRNPLTPRFAAQVHIAKFQQFFSHAVAKTGTTHGTSGRADGAENRSSTAAGKTTSNSTDRLKSRGNKRAHTPIELLPSGQFWLRWCGGRGCSLTGNTFVGQPAIVDKERPATLRVRGALGVRLPLIADKNDFLACAWVSCRLK
jgi:hypothetical protein